MAENTARKQRSRSSGRPFAPGTSGNPNGKPRGARHATTVLAEKLMADDAGEVVKAVVRAAKTGDMTAARLVLERILPVRKGRPIEFELPPINTAEDVAAALAAVAGLMAQGTLSPDEAAIVAGVIETRRKAIETGELASRIAALEAATINKGTRS